LDALNVLTITVCAVIGLMAVQLTFFLVEILFAAKKGRSEDEFQAEGSRPSVAVLVPAHNEQKVLAHALKAILPQVLPSDRLVVIADNCTDSTADLARKMGAIVVERRDTVRVGKGYAVDAGARYLEAQPPEVVVVIDADCIPQEGTISRLARAAKACDRPVQAAYLMTAPAGSRGETQLREAMVLLKNFVRPLGLHRLGLPCLLTGSGMAFPWKVFRDAPLASGNRVDDLQLAVDLAISGALPRFCPAAHVTNVLPSEVDASRLQRSGWMEGHLRTLLTQVPRLLASAVRQGKLSLAILALELSLPPLSMLILGWGLVSILAVGIYYPGGSRLPLWGALYSGAALLASGMVFWAKFGRARVPAKALLALPLLFRHSISAAFAAAFTRPKPWVRTSR
jgi:cellulose synthase/poly-beta-1,6-N-acetylglucosamine synthase-like glycosyltransferase